jgi:hypothetical protein
MISPWHFDEVRAYTAETMKDPTAADIFQVEPPKGKLPMGQFAQFHCLGLQKR